MILFVHKKNDFTTTDHPYAIVLPQAREKGKRGRICLQRVGKIVIILNMTLYAPLPPTTTPELARRLGVILAALAGLVAARFLRRPELAGLIVPLWRRLTHVARRFEQAAVAVPRRVRVRAARIGERKVGVRLPGGQGWLVRVLGYEAAGYGSQLAHFLDDAEMRALIAAVPGVGRVLRPVCWMLGLPEVRAAAEVAAVDAASAANMLVRRRAWPLWPRPGKLTPPAPPMPWDGWVAPERSLPRRW